MRLSAMLLAFALAACSKSSDATTSPTNPTTASIAGVYTLRTINASSLPYVVSQPGQPKVEVVDDTYTINDNAAWTEAGHVRTTTNGTVLTTLITDSGTYFRSGSAVGLLSTASGVTNVVISGDTLSYTSFRGAFVYSK
jgi:hypothetical protein